MLENKVAKLSEGTTDHSVFLSARFDCHQFYSWVFHGFKTEDYRYDTEIGHFSRLLLVSFNKLGFSRLQDTIRC